MLTLLAAVGVVALAFLALVAVGLALRAVRLHQTEPGFDVREITALVAIKTHRNVTADVRPDGTVVLEIAPPRPPLATNRLSGA